MLRKYLAVTAAMLTIVAANGAQAQEQASWTGAYVGVGVSGTNMETDQDSVQPGYSFYHAADYGGKHLYGYAQLGADVQLGNVVVGAQIRHERTGSDGDSLWKVDELVTANAKHITNLTARAGYLVKPKLLLYANAGVSFGHFDYASVDERWDQVDDSLRANREGVSFGAGAEYRLGKRVSVVGEYVRTQYKRESSTFDYGEAYTPSWTYDFKHKLDSLKLGVNYRF